jgi:type II secretory pathway pseudopilin PulG
MDKKPISGVAKPAFVKVSIKERIKIKKHYKTIVVIIIIALILSGCAFGILKYINWQKEIETAKVEKQKKSTEIKIDTQALEKIKDWKYHGTPIDLKKEFSGRNNPFVPY